MYGEPEYTYTDAKGREWSINMWVDYEEDNMKNFYDVKNPTTGEYLKNDPRISPYSYTWKSELENFLDNLEDSKLVY